MTTGPLPRSSAPRVLAWLLIPACLLMLAPFATLLRETSWRDFTLAYGDARAVGTSFGLGLVAIVAIALLGTPLALWQARTRAAIRPLVDALVLATAATPPLAMGILLVSVYGPYGSVGGGLARLGLTLNNNPAAFVLAQVYAGIGYYVLAARNAFEAFSPVAEQAAQSLGANGWQTFRRVTLPLAARGLLGGLVLAWVRLIGEFGIVMVFAYFPQGIPVKLYVDLQDEGLDAVYALLWVLLLMTLPLPVLGAFRRRR
ncbi:ABC transporter permease subunit [Roseomonas elaeocarpi]|uniref:ABC transporter permease subunit n=1 Tax=Roseomonas elaeocarpi TaxID=907779 RepID=A0ABV6JMC9_9PROT